MELSIKLSDPLCMPTRANRTDAGLDLRSNHPSFFLLPHETKLIDTGLAVKIPEGYGGLVFARSGMGKFNVSPANCVGIIDSDYRGNIKINLHNYSLMSFEIPQYFRIGQLVITGQISNQSKAIDVSILNPGEFLLKIESITIHFVK